MPVQIVFASGHTSESYVSERGWCNASIERCGECGGRLRRHTTYSRKVPEGTRIARFRCPNCKRTYSLLPSFLSSHFSDTVAAFLQVVHVAATAPSFDAAASMLRPDIELQGARRWLRRRLLRYALLVRLVAALACIAPETVDLSSLREPPMAQLASLPTPVGLSHRRIEHWQSRRRAQHTMGPDPPP